MRTFYIYIFFLKFSNQIIQLKDQNQLFNAVIIVCVAKA